MSLLDKEEEITTKALESELRPMFEKFLCSSSAHAIIYGSLHLKFAEIQTQIDMLKDRVEYLENKLGLINATLETTPVCTDLFVERDDDGNIKNVLPTKNTIK
jgi:hypothetical protein